MKSHSDCCIERSTHLPEPLLNYQYQCSSGNPPSHLSQSYHSTVTLHDFYAYFTFFMSREYEACHLLWMDTSYVSSYQELSSTKFSISLWSRQAKGPSQSQIGPAAHVYNDTAGPQRRRSWIETMRPCKRRGRQSLSHALDLGAVATLHQSARQTAGAGRLG